MKRFFALIATVILFGLVSASAFAGCDDIGAVDNNLQCRDIAANAGYPQFQTMSKFLGGVSYLECYGCF
jgi:hypothetical protein